MNEYNDRLNSGDKNASYMQGSDANNAPHSATSPVNPYNEVYSASNAAAPTSSRVVPPNPGTRGQNLYPMPPKKQSHGWIVAIVIVACLCITMMFSIAMCSSSVSGVISSMGFNSVTGDQQNVSSPSIAVIDLNGTIQYDGTMCSPEGLKKALDRAAADPNVKGVILRVNSGGGTATAGEEMARYVWDFPKPTAVVSESTNASAAYEISSQADRIFTAKTTTIGSIGVVMQVSDLSGLYEKLGINIESIASADSKDSSYGNRPLTDEERAWYQRMIDQISEDFIATVAQGRHMDVEEVRLLANGLPYTGIDAVSNGLADEIGGLDQAIDYISSESGYDEPLRTFSYTTTSSDLSRLLDLISKDNTQTDNKALQALSERLDAGNAFN